MKLGILFLIAIASGLERSNPLNVLLGLGAEVVKAGLNIGNAIFNSRPIPKEFEHIQNKDLQSIPLEIATSLLDDICKMHRMTNNFYIPDMRQLHFVYFADSGAYYIPLADPLKLFAFLDFKSPIQLVIYIPGWIADPHIENSVSAIEKAYKCRGGTIFLSLDVTEYLFSLDMWSAFDTEIVGKNLAVALERLNRIIPAENIHLIGHSLGAHIAGYAGRYFTTLTGRKITRITGLDPARPCLSYSGLRSSDALFVDVIHANVGVLGLREAIGTVDLYANVYSTVFVPGCWDIVCSHLRVVSYFAESVYPGNEFNFMVLNLFPMGFAIPMNIRGSYNVEVNSYAPFGKKSWRTNYNNCKRGMGMGNTFQF